MEEEKQYKLSTQFKETLLTMITKSVITAMTVEDDSEVYSVESALDELIIGIDDMGEILILNPPKVAFTAEDIEKLQNRQ